MRIKAIPAEIGSYAEHHPYVLLGGVALLAIGSYYYYNANFPNENNTDVAASSAIPFSYAMPQMAGTVGGGGGGGTGVIDTVTNPNAISPADKAAIDLEWAALGLATTKESHDYSIAKQTLAAQLAISKTNADVAFAGIASANYSTDASLAQSFIQSGQMFTAGQVGGLSFGFLGTGAPVDGTSKNARKTIAMNEAEFSSLLSNSTVQGYLNYGSQPAASSQYSSSPGVYPTIPAYGPTGSPSYSPAPSSASAYSSQPAISSASYGGSVSRFSTAGSANLA